MSIKITPALLAELKEKAGNATPEFVREGYFIYGPKHPRSQHPNGRIFITRIVEGSNRRDPNLDGGAWMTGSGTADAEYIAAANPQVVLALIAKIEQLEKEANWLAQELAKFCSRADCDKCEYVGQQWEENTFCNVLSLGVNSPDTWREAAHKAVEEECQR